MTKRLAIFAGYDSAGQIHDYVVYYLKELKKVADVVFVSDNHFSPDALSPIQDLIIHSICLPHGEYDFGSYKRGYLWAKENGLLDKYDSLIFCNDSVFGPFRPLEPIFEQFEQKVKIDFWGMFCHHGSRTPLYIQSYFAVLKKQVFQDEAFHHFMLSVQKENRKVDVVIKYEVGLSRLLLKKGFRPDALFESTKNNSNNKNALKIIKNGFPFLKKALYNPSSHIFCGYLDYRKTLKQINSSYDPSLIDDYLRQQGKVVESHSYYLFTNYIDKLKAYSKRVKRFFFQKKIDKHGRLIIKIFKIHIYKSRRYFTFSPTPEDVFVSVVMPVYNGGETLKETVESILSQSYSNFEFVIVDDCSTDNSYAILEGYAHKDSRIKLFRTKKNFGNPGGASAYGIDRVSKEAKYIVMTDQDDISIKIRLKLQIRIMESNPYIDIAGGRMKMFGAKSRTTNPRQEDPAIKALLLTSSPISNPTLIIRKRFLDNNNLNYRNQTSHDYRLLAEAALEHRALFYNMKIVLLRYRCHGQQTSVRHKAAIRKTSDQVRAYQLKKMGVTRQADIDFFNAWKAKELQPTEENLKQLKSIFETIIKTNRETFLFSHYHLTKRFSYLYKKELLKSRNPNNIFKFLFFDFSDNREKHTILTVKQVLG